MIVPQLKTQRLCLRPFNEADLQNVYLGLSNPEVIKYYGVSYSTLEGTKEQMKWFKSLEQNGTGVWWAICSNQTGEFFGAAGLNNLFVEHQKAELGFWLLPAYWGKGIIVEACSTIIEYAFKSLNLHRIEALVESENQNSTSALKKLKFNHEGTMQDYELKNGRFISLHIYARINVQ